MNQRQPLTPADRLAAVGRAIYGEYWIKPFAADRYTYVPTIAVVEGLAKEGFYPTFACQAVPKLESKHAHTKHMLRFRREADLGKRESVEAVVINSHDGTTSYQLLTGLFRFICSNGMVCGDRFGEIRVPHKGDVVQDVIEGVFSVVKDSDKVLEAVEIMKQIELKPAEQMAFAEAAAMMRLEPKEGEKLPIEATRFLHARRGEDQGSDLWRTFNRVQENTIRGGLHGRRIGADNKSRAVTTKEVRGID